MASGAAIEWPGSGRRQSPDETGGGQGSATPRAPLMLLSLSGVRGGVGRYPASTRAVPGSCRALSLLESLVKGSGHLRPRGASAFTEAVAGDKNGDDDDDDDYDNDEWPCGCVLYGRCVEAPN